MDMQTETPLVADERQFKNVIDAVPIGLVMVDQEGKILLTNQELEKQFGYTADEMLGNSMEMLLPERYRDRHPSLRAGYLQRPQSRAMGMGRELFGRQKSGAEFPVEIGLNPIETGAGLAVIASISDISIRKRLEANFKQIVDASPVGNLMVDNHGTIQLVNPRLCQLFGYEPHELVGKSLEILLPYSYRQGHVGLRNAFMEQPDARVMGAGRDLSGLRKDGSEVAVEVGLSPIETENGPAVVAAVTDISQRKKMELDLRQLNSDLDEFTYIASHDLRAPLRGIASLVEWISEDLEAGNSSSVQKNLERINVRVTRMERLIDDLLEYAWAGRERKEFHEIEISALLDDVIALIDVPEQFDIEIHTDIDHILSARTPLETVLRNLISNAIKHHDRDRGRIEVMVVTEGSFCVFSVKDDGPGIPAAAQQRIFRLFQTLSGKRQENAGLGLAFSKRLVESYGGSMEVLSQQGQRGTTFRFSWPYASR